MTPIEEVALAMLIMFFLLLIAIGAVSWDLEDQIKELKREIEALKAKEAEG